VFLEYVLCSLRTSKSWINFCLFCCCSKR
jgi:hypothetical protein